MRAVAESIDAYFAAPRDGLQMASTGANGQP
jgi:hypothetical protein